MAGKGDAKNRARRRKVQINDATADLLEARAAALGISVAELIAAIAGREPAPPPGPASGDPEAVASDIPAPTAAPPEARWREVKAWIDSWGKSNELPRPKLGK